MYKNYSVLIIFFFLSITVFAKNKSEDNIKIKPRVEIGYLGLYNTLNSDIYYKLKYSNATDNGNANIAGFSLKLNLPTKYEYMDIFVGSLFIEGLDEIYFESIDPSSVNYHDYSINGGGVYFGISPKLKGKIFSLTSDFGVGVFSFKEYVSIVNNIKEPFVDIHNSKASYGLGAISSLGFSINVGKFGINPSIVGIFSGGSGTSFTFYGFNLPINYQF